MAIPPVNGTPAQPPPDEPNPSDEPDADSAYDYGSTTEEVPAGYVSDAELLAWLQAKSTGQYGELDQLMDASNARSKLVKDLSHLKETLANPTLDPAKAAEEIEALRKAYAGTEHADELEAVLGPLQTEAQAYASALAAIAGPPGGPDAANLAIEAGERAANAAANGEAGVPAADAPEEEVNSWAVAQMKAAFSANLTESAKGIDALTKDLEHDDQLALVSIQALMSEIRETAQLTSNIIANRSQTSDSIVGNIRA